MSKPTDRTQQRTQKTGAYAALAVAGVFVLLVAYFIVFGGGGGRSQKPTTPADLSRPDSLVPLGQGPGAVGQQGQLLGAKGVRFDLTDKLDPTKRTGVVTFAAMDPLEGHRYAVDKPEAWLYLRGGRSVFIRADSGQVYRPDGQEQPESGTIRGNVEIKLFEAGIDFQSIDPMTTEALMVVKTDSLAFEAAVGEVATPDAFVVTWNGGKFEGEGLSLVFDQPNERLARGEVQRNSKLTLTSAARDKARKAVASEQPETAPTAQAPTAPATSENPAAAPIETIYRLVGGGTVVAKQATRTLAADRFQVLARLINNELPADAIKEVQFVRDEPAPSARPQMPAPSAAPGNESSAQIASTGQPTEEPLVMTWEGPCVIVPLAEAPPELAQDHIAARFSAESGKRVTIADSERGIDGYAAAIDYGTTSRRLSLTGPEVTSVMLNIPESGSIQTRRILADLATGIINTPGAGTLTSARATEGTAQTLTWTERGEFAFLTTDQGLTGHLKSALVVGAVKGEGRGLDFTSNEANATFAAPGEGQKRAALATVDLKGDAVATSADTGRMTGQKIHVEFDPAAPGRDDARARFVRAEDGFTVEREGQWLSGDYLESRLIDVGNGKVDVGSVLARGDVKFASEKDFVTGETQELRADLGFDEDGNRRQLVHLVGDGTFISRDEPGLEQGRVTGTQLVVDGVKGGLEGFGAGSFTYRGVSGTDTASIDASWTRRMVFDDTAGTIDCWGDSVTHYSPDAATRNKVEADRVELFLTPNATGRSLFATGFGSRQEQSKPASARDRSVLAAEAYGSILDREGGVNARIESRTYAGTENRELQKLSYIEGPSILASNEKGTIDVPGRGKFLLLDQSEAKKVAESPGVRDLGGDTRGVSLFEWATSLHAEKNAAGDTTMTMKDGVGIVHRALQDGQVTEIKCDALIANLKDRESSLAEAGRGLELQSVTATGGVYAASGPPKTAAQPRPPLRELIAHALEYDAIKRRIEAKAQPGGVVTMFEPAAASPTTAAWLTWDLTTNAIQVRQPAGVTPR